MDLFSRRPYQAVKPVQPLRPVIQTQQSIFSAFFPVKHRVGPGPHAFLDLLNIVFGSLESVLQVTDRVPHLLDVLPNP